MVVKLSVFVISVSNDAKADKQIDTIGAVTWLVAWTTLAASFASSSYSAAIPQVQQDFPGYSPQVYIMGVRAFVLGYAFGPLLWAPVRTHVFKFLCHFY
jgi:hypothetical protein